MGSGQRASAPPATRSGQLRLAFPCGWGGARRGAGRKRVAVRSCTPHRARPAHRQSEPAHVTLRSHLHCLRTQFLFPTVRTAIGRATRRDAAAFRVVHFSVQSDHVHLVVEARDKAALSAGVRSVAIRIALYVNQLLRRRGQFWADRWHGRALASPREVRNALVYVLANFRKHARRALPGGVDPFSSAAWFDGYGTDQQLRFAARSPPCRDTIAPVSSPRTWLLGSGWKRHGLIGTDEAPE
jgi:putative transposase